MAVAGHAMRAQDTITVGFSADLGVAGAGVLFHELTHVALLEDAASKYPSWYHEGIAELLGSASFRENLAFIGAVPRSALASLQDSEPLELDVLFEIQHPFDLEADDVHRFYADAWALVRFMHGQIGSGAPNYYDEMVTFLGYLNRGRPWREAFVDSFPGSVDEFAQQLDAFRQGAASGVSYVQVVELAPVVPELEPESIAPAEIAHRLGIYARTTRSFALSVEFYDFAIGLEADDRQLRAERAVVLALGGHHELASADLERITGSVPESATVAEANAWILLAQHDELEDPERDEAAASELLASARAFFRKALGSESRSPRCWSGLVTAYALDERSDATEGLAAVRAAYELLPKSAALELARATLLARSGQREEARAALTRLFDSEVGDEARSLLAEIDAELDGS